MLFKISLNDQTHLMKLKNDQGFKELSEHITKAFKKLPSRYNLVYLDEEGDQISLDNQHDLESLIDGGLTKITVLIKQVQSLQVSQKQKQQQLIKVLQKPKFEVGNLLAKQQILIEPYINDQLEKKASILDQLREEPSIMDQLKKELLLQDQLKKKRRKIFAMKQPKNAEKILKQQIKEQKEKMDKEEQQKQNKLLKKKSNFIHENIRCDICGIDPIIGLRYKCTVCPDYDLCEYCQGAYDHDHALIKIKFSEQQFEKQYYTPVEIIGSKVISGAQLIKKGFSSAISTIRKLSSTQQKRVEQKPKIQDNMIAAIDKIMYKQPVVKQQPKVQKIQPKQLSEQDIKIQSANYLSQVLGADFSRCYKFVLKFPGLKKEDLIVQYFNNVKDF